MALSVDDFALNFYDSILKKKYSDWNKMEDFVFYTTYDAFVFGECTHTFRMLHKTVNNLIPTGIMKYLIEEYYTKKWNFKKPESDPKVLDLNDLEFGFLIWLGFFPFSFLAFSVELCLKYRIRSKKVKFAKIHPELSDPDDDLDSDLNSELVEKFRIKKKCNVALDSDIDLIFGDVV
jgi:hypothetical protein